MTIKTTRKHLADKWNDLIFTKISKNLKPVHTDFAMTLAISKMRKLDAYKSH